MYYRVNKKFKSTRFCLSGWMYDVSGSYDGAFIVMGCIWSVSLGAMFVEVVMHRCGWNTRAEDTH